MSEAHHLPAWLGPIIVFLAAAVIAVPLFRLAGLGAVVGYIAAGFAIGPSGFGVVSDPATTLGVAELGIVLLLFVIGLELKPSRLLAMRRDIAGLGFGQMMVSTLALSAGFRLIGLSWPAAVLAGIALAFSATSIALQLLDERGALQRPWGQRAFAVLLFQDISVVPVLALAPLLASGPQAAQAADLSGRLLSGALALGAVAAMILAGRYLLNPFFQLLARAGSREAMSAGALLVALGAATAMQWAGMSMALGAFLAGLLLSESNFRHQLEADIEPFRGLLMGLFFMSVGMSLDGKLILSEAALLLGVAAFVILAKIMLTFAVMRLGRATRCEALDIASVLTPAGEFSFVLIPLGVQAGLFDARSGALLLATAALTMLLGPILAKLIERVADRTRPVEEEAADLAPDGSKGSVLVIGFGRFGQLVNQVLLGGGVDVTVIDRNVDRIRAAGRFGFKVYYGDGARLDVLRAAGAESARVIAICIDDREAATRIVELARAHFPLARIHARSYDRIHSIALRQRGVDLDMRETLESALAFGGATFAAVTGDPERAADLVSRTRRRDAERLATQMRDGGITAQGRLIYAFPVHPEPLTPPRTKMRGLTPESERILQEGEAAKDASPPA